MNLKRNPSAFPSADSPIQTETEQKSLLTTASVSWDAAMTKTNFSHSTVSRRRRINPEKDEESVLTPPGGPAFTHAGSSVEIQRGVLLGWTSKPPAERVDQKKARLSMDPRVSWGLPHSQQLK